MRKTRQAVSCGGAQRAGEGELLAQLVEEYIREYRPGEDLEFRAYEVCESLREAIERAAMSLTSGIRHPHQRRGFKLSTLEAARDALLKRESEVASVSTFAELHNLIAETIGPNRTRALYVYDVATRIGAKQNLWPQDVYLHAGTREGAKKLGFNVRGQRTLKISDLRSKIGTEIDRLQPYELEDFICIFADRISPR